MKYIILLILLVNTTTIKAQIINGVVLSKKDKEPIIGAIFMKKTRFYIILINMGIFLLILKVQKLFP